MFARNRTLHLESLHHHAIHTVRNSLSLPFIIWVKHDNLVKVAIAHMSKNTRKQSKFASIFFGYFYKHVSSTLVPMVEKNNLPISSAIRDKGTATSVDQIWVPSGRAASDAQRACFLADHNDCICSSMVADSNDWQLFDLTMSFARRILS